MPTATSRHPHPPRPAAGAKGARLRREYRRRRFTRRQRLLFTLRILAVFGGATILASDWPSRRANSFWTTYPFLTSFFSGCLLVVITYLIVDAAIAYRNTVKWQSVAHSAFKALGEICSDVSDALGELVATQDDRRHSVLEGILAPRLYAEIRAAASLRHTANEFADRPDYRTLFARALLASTANPTWCDNAQRATVHMRSMVRSELSKWLAAMLVTSELAQIANRVALLDHRLADLQGALLQVSRGYGRGDEHPDADAAQGAVQSYELMQSILLETCALHEGLNRSADADRTDYRHIHWQLRNRLDPRHLEILRSHDESLAGSLTTPLAGATV